MRAVLMVMVIGVLVGAEQGYGQASVESSATESLSTPRSEGMESMAGAAVGPIWLDEQGTREVMLIDFGQVKVGQFVDTLVRFWYDQPGVLLPPVLSNGGPFWTAFFSSRQLTAQQPGLRSDTFTIAFQPPRTGSFRDTLTFTDSVNGNRTIYLKGIGVTGPLRAAPDPVEFDSVAIGGCRTIPVTVTSVGLLQRVMVSVAGANGPSPFRISANTVTVDSGESRTLFVALCPISAGEFHDTLLLGSDTSLRRIPLHGYGIPVLSVRPDSLSFDTVMVGHCVVDTIAVTNWSDTLVVDLDALASRLSMPPELTVTAMAGQGQLQPRQTAGLLITYCADESSGALFTRELSYTIDTVTLLSYRVRAYPVAPVLPIEDTLRVVATDTCKEKTVRIVNNSDHSIPRPTAAWDNNTDPRLTLVRVEGNDPVLPGESFTIRYSYCPDRNSIGPVNHQATMSLRFPEGGRPGSFGVRILVDIPDTASTSDTTFLREIDFGKVDTGKCDTVVFEFNAPGVTLRDVADSLTKALRARTVQVVYVEPGNMVGSVRVALSYCPNGVGAVWDTIYFVVGRITYALPIRGEGAAVRVPKTFYVEIDFGMVDSGSSKGSSIEIDWNWPIRIEQDNTSFDPPDASEVVLTNSFPLDIPANSRRSLSFQYTPTSDDSLDVLWTAISTTGDTIRIRLLGKGNGFNPTRPPRTLGLSTTGGRVGERIVVHLYVDPPIETSEGITNVRARLTYDTISLVYRRTGTIPGLPPPSTTQGPDDTLTIQIGDGTSNLEGDTLASIEFVGLTTGNPENPLRIVAESVTGFPIPPSIRDGGITLEGCDFGRDLKLTNKGNIVAITGDASGTEFTLHYRAPMGSRPQVRVVALDGSEKLRLTLPEGDESEQSARVIPEDLAPGLYLLELRAGSDRTATLFMVGG